jgi:hypothetical protein
MQWSWPTVLWYFPTRQRLQLVSPPPTGEYWTSVGDEYLAIAHPWQIRFVVTFGEFLTNLPAAHFNIKAHDAFPPFPHCQYPIGHVEQELLEPAVDLYLPNTHFAHSILLWFWKSKKKDIDKIEGKKQWQWHQRSAVIKKDQSLVQPRFATGKERCNKITHNQLGNCCKLQHPHFLLQQLHTMGKCPLLKQPKKIFPNYSQHKNDPEKLSRSDWRICQLHIWYVLCSWTIGAR